MDDDKKEFKILCDGFLIKRLMLSPSQYETQKARDVVRLEQAKLHSVPMHYLRLTEVSYKICHKKGKFHDDKEDGR